MTYQLTDGHSRKEPSSKHHLFALCSSLQRSTEEKGYGAKRDCHQCHSSVHSLAARRLKRSATSEAGIQPTKPLQVSPTFNATHPSCKDDTIKPVYAFIEAEFFAGSRPVTWIKFGAVITIVSFSLSSAHPTQ